MSSLAETDKDTSHQLKGKVSLEAPQKLRSDSPVRKFKALMSSNQLDNRSRFFEHMEVEAGWEVAIETVLGSVFTSSVLMDWMLTVYACQLEGSVSLLSLKESSSSYATQKPGI